jgi:hypothetical protein
MNEEIPYNYCNSVSRLVYEEHMLKNIGWIMKQMDIDYVLGQILGEIETLAQMATKRSWNIFIDSRIQR